MNTHKDRLRAIASKDSSLNRQRNRSTSLHQSGRSTSRLTENEEKIHKIKPERAYSDEEIGSQGRVSPLYMNVNKSETQETSLDDVDYEKANTKRNTKSMDRLPNYSQWRNTTMRSNGNLNTSMTHIYKSRSLNALKAENPSKVLMKSSIQQEYHDKAVRRYFKGLRHGKSRKPCQIATAMFVLFGLTFISGLVVIGLRYLYENIFMSHNAGDALGPSLIAGSFIFLGIGIKFMYDSHKLSRKERRNIGYQGVDRNYVGVRSNLHNLHKAHEKLVSGTATEAGLSRVPNRIQTLNPDNPTLARSTQSKIYTRTERSSDI